MKLRTSRKVAACVVIILLVFYIFCLPKVLFDVPYSTVVTDRNGELLGARIAADGQWRFPARLTSPDKLKQCVIAFEDRSFKHHWGVNPLAIARASIQNIKKRRVVSGGSTLTMQVIRLSRNKPRTIKEKIIESIWATRLEFRYSKDEIFALYATHAPFGGNVVGWEAASWRYFGHTGQDLSWAEAATLAVLPNAPSMIHLSKGRTALLVKRNRLLTYLKDKGTIDALTYELALSEPLPEEPMPLPQTAPHLVTYMYEHRKGLHTRASVDKHIQTRVESIVARWNNEFTQSDIRHLAAIVIDVQTNEVVAYCGNVKFEEGQEGNQVDIIRSPRSTGSILKPFLYYAMLREGQLLPHTLLPDIPMNISGFAPRNFNGRFEGAVSASQALARSLNIPTVQMLRDYGVPKFHHLLKDIGISTLTKPSSHYGLSLILGGAEGTLWDITSAYTQMARALSGFPEGPCALVLDDEPQAPKTSRWTGFHPGAVWQTFNVMKEVNRPEEIDWHLIPSMRTVAWKTGTSYGFRDAWAVGVTPRYAVGVWVGNATGEGKPGLVGARAAAPVMFDIFNMLPSAEWFQTPYSEFIEAEVCSLSGHLKGRFCEKADTILIVPEGLKTSPCPYHHAVTLTADEKYRVYADCAGDEPLIRRGWFTLPPAWEWYYKPYHPEYRSLPPFKMGCGEDIYSPMQFIYPEMNARVRLPKQLDGSPGVLTVELAHSRKDAVVYWHLDDTYLTQTEDFHKITLTPSQGKHSITVVDQEGNRRSVTVWVE